MRTMNKKPTTAQLAVFDLSWVDGYNEERDIHSYSCLLCWVEPEAVRVDGGVSPEGNAWTVWGPSRDARHDMDYHADNPYKIK